MRPNSASWLRNITHGSEEHNDTAGRNARFGGSTSPFNRGSTRSLQGASNASRGTRRQTYPDPRSPSSARFAYSPSAVPSGAPPPPTYPSLFTRDEESFKAWMQTQAPPECVMHALDSEPMSGAEFKMHTTDGDKIHPSATKGPRTRGNMLRHWETQTSCKQPPIVTGIKGARQSRACLGGLRRRLQQLE